MEKKILIFIIFFGLTNFQTNLKSNVSELIYLVTDNQVIDENVCPSLMILWSKFQKAVQLKSNYVVKAVSVNSDRDKLLTKLENAKLVLDITYNSKFALSLLPLAQQNKWLLNKMVVFLFEPPAVCLPIWDASFHSQLALVFTWDDSLFNQKNYAPMRFPSHFGEKLDLKQVVPFEQRKLCCLINCYKRLSHPKSLYQKRLDDIMFFEINHPDVFDFYGVGWPTNKYKTYRGQIPLYHKMEYLKKYKFSLCYENMQAPGWVTEKIFHCFHAGCVPVYLGADNIKQFVPDNCFIDRGKFKNMAELYQFLNNMSQAEYDNYLVNIKQYLDSSQPYEFAQQRTTEYIMAGILSLKLS